MKLILSSVLLSCAHLALGYPSRFVSADIHGAAYFITNDPINNYVVSADIRSDGSLAYRRAVRAGGSGAHGITTPLGPDALFSQGAIEVSPAGNLLAAVNAGSNTIALFSVDPARPSNIKMLGKPVSSEGQFPMSLAFNSDGTRLCTLNGGKVNGVSCFHIDNKLGLVSLQNTFRSLSLNQTTPATGPAGTASHVIFSEDGSQLIASIKGLPPTPGFLAIWDIANDGSLSANFTSIPPPSGGLLLFSMTPVIGKNALLVTDPIIGFDIVDLGDSSKSSAVNISGQGATCWSSFSKKTGNYYLTDLATSTITEVYIDDNLNGTVVKQYPQQSMSGTIDNDIATIGGNDFLYVLTPNTTSVQVLELKSPGNAAKVQSFDYGKYLNRSKIAFNPVNVQGMSVFVM